MTDFHAEMAEGYGTEAAIIGLGRPYLDADAPLTDVEVGIPLNMLNRHGLIAGATGTGKTITLQLLAEQISAAGCPVFAADMKGDLSGVGAPGTPGERISKRANQLAYDWAARGAPVELWSFSAETGVPVRASVASFGPILLARVLELNETQESTLSLVFRYCDERKMALIDLADLRTVLAYLAGPGKDDLATLGGVSKATVGVMLRKLGELEAKGGDRLFGEPEVALEDLLRTTDDGRGMISVLHLVDVAASPTLFSTFLMWLVAELFEELPEVGDPERPTLVFFLDEAHLLFNDATKAFRSSVAQTVRLIRSKGVGVFFVTQLPTDLPDEVLSQLGHRVQHAVRAFTPRDAKALREVVQTYPTTEHYALEETLQSLGVGEAAVTVLDPDGVPTPVAATRIFPPASRIGPLTPEERAAIIDLSPLTQRYGTTVNRESAEELLAAKLNNDPDRARETRDSAPRTPPAPRRSEQDEDIVGRVSDLLNSRVGKQVTREVVRGIFGMLRRR
ncbi:MAG: helicase HerA-like domain-containing protein [Thermoleophilia bacterium]